MLEGLEISVLNLSELNEELRYESEFFRKPILEAQRQIEAIPHSPLGTLAPKIQHPAEVERIYSDSGLRLLLAQEVRSNQLSLGEGSFMPDSILSKLAANKLVDGDVVLTRSGANVGQCAPIKTSVPLFACADLLVIRKGKLPGGYLSTFLNTSHGRLLLERGAYGMAQPHIAPTYLKTLPIPMFGKAFLAAVETLIELAEASKTQIATQLEIAEKKLLGYLQLENWQPPNPFSYTRSSADAFAAGRLDAEHFKPKFAELITHIENTGNAARLGSLLAINDRGNQPAYAEIGLPVVNSKHIANNDVRLDTDNRVGVASAAKVLIEPGDVLMNGTGVGTIGRSAPYLHTGKAIPDNHVTILRPTNAAVDPVYLSVFINSLAGQLQVEQRLHGSSGQIELYPTDIADFTIWLAPEAVQQEIRQAVESGFTAKQRAAQLLEAAKRAVEIAIEDSEAAALCFLAEFNTTSIEPNAPWPLPEKTGKGKNVK